MLTLPVAIIGLLQPFGTMFHAKTWKEAQILLVGAIVAPGKRTVTSVASVFFCGLVALAIPARDSIALHMRPSLATFGLVGPRS